MPRPHIRVVAAEIERDGRYLITQRRSRAIMPDLWEFPGGRVEPGESDPAALERELLEKIGAPSVVGELALHVTHAYEDYTLDFVVYRVQLTGEPSALRVATVRWVALEEFDQYTFPGADKRTVDALLTDLDEAQKASP